MAGEYFMVKDISDITFSAKNVIAELEGLSQLPAKEAKQKLKELSAKGEKLAGDLREMARRLFNESGKYMKRSEGDMHASAMASKIVPQTYEIADQIIEEINKAKQALKESQEKEAKEQEESKPEKNEQNERESEEQGPSQE